MRELAIAAFEQVTSYDGRIWRTVRAVLFQPGLLARAHFDGQRTQYLSPFRIFVLANVAAWFLIPLVKIRGFSLKEAKREALFAPFWKWAMEARADFSGISVETLAARIQAIGAAEDAGTVLCMVPLFALGTMVVMRGRGYRYVQHLVFAAHFYCIHLLAVLFFMGAILTIWVAPAVLAMADSPTRFLIISVLRINWVQHALVIPILLPYLYEALKRAYQLTSRQSAWRAVVLTLWAVTVARSFFDLAFGLVLLFV